LEESLDKASAHPIGKARIRKIIEFEGEFLPIDETKLKKMKLE
jgi:hypothetical protein